MRSPESIPNEMCLFIAARVRIRPPRSKSALPTQITKMVNGQKAKDMREICEENPEQQSVDKMDKLVTKPYCVRPRQPALL